jgi:DeoR family transcriptional regulator of aga operon
MKRKRSESKSTVNRRTAILELLGKEGQVDVNELSKSLGVSSVTIRNDLEQLEKRKMLLRARGGAMKVQQHFVGHDYPHSDKQKKNYPEKQAIGKRAVEFVQEENIIILDSGSTTFEVAKNLEHFENLTVITNAINIATYLADHKNITVIVPGGNLRKNSMSLVGTTADRALKEYYCDILFLGVDGLDPEFGISTPNIEEAHLNQIMIEMSKKVIVVADSSKFRRRGFAFIASMDALDVLITDSGISEDEKSKLLSMGVDVVTV